MKTRIRPRVNPEFKWAATTLLELCTIPASPKYLASFENSSQNQQWIYGIVRKAQPQVGSMTSDNYNKAIEILIANGVKVNPYMPGNGQR